MSHQIVGMILIYLKMTASEEEIQILQSPAQVWLPSGETAQLDCSLSKKEWSVMWYKEQSRNLQWIYQSSPYAITIGKYLSKVNITANQFSLIIRNVQRDDSGVYYCGLSASVYLQPNFGNGTRLIVTDASEPRISILVPSTPEDTELPPILPLLCLLSDVTPPWMAVLWDTGEEEESEGQMDAGAIDGKGVFSVWSLMTIPSETWNLETTCTCTAKESSTGRRINATGSKETERRDSGECMIVLYAGLPCIFVLLLIQLLILLWRKCPIRGRAVQRGNQIPMRQIPQTEYATLPYNRNVPV